jgi:hypothetical protein
MQSLDLKMILKFNKRIPMKKTLLSTLVLIAAVSFAKPPAGVAGERAEGNREERHAKMESQIRMKYVLAISEALELSEADTLKLADKVKASAEKRRPIRQQMMEAMHSVKLAAEGDASAQSQVDANVQKVFDLRTQMSVLDKEMYQVLAKDLSPQKKAKLAVALAQLGKGGAKGDEDREERRHERGF